MLGRSAERERIDHLLTCARSGRSEALVLLGEAGIGKTTLLDYAVSQAKDMQVLCTRGYETESEIPFAGLADLLRPVVHLFANLPKPQAAALESALALGPAVAGDRFSVCAATVGILTEAAATVPTLVIVDDLHWLDMSSKEAVLFAGRRLKADGIGLLLAAREDHHGDAMDLHLPPLRLSGLSRRDADELCLGQVPGVPETVREQLFSATAGNPLGLVELAEAWRTHPVDSAVAAPLVPSGSSIERALRARIAELPERARRALLVAAAGAGGDTGTTLVAARLSGLDLGDFAPAEAAHLVTIGDRRIDFRHPLLRSVLYHSASTEARCGAHRALAEALADVPGDTATDLRAWHLAAATLAPDDEVAAQLEKAAFRARSRAGYVAAARGFEHAVRLSTGAARPRQLIRAARCWQLAGRNSKVLPLLDEALPLATDPAQRALIKHMDAFVRMWRGRPHDVLRFLVESAEEVEDVDPGRAAQMYADATVPYVMVGELDHLETVAQRAYELGVRVGGVARLSAAVAVAGSLALRRQQARAVRLLRECQPALAQVDPLVRAHDLCHAALTWIWLEGYPEAEALIERLIGHARRAGALGVLPQALAIASELHYRVGRWADARACAGESLRLADETRQATMYALFFAARMDAVQGRVEECLRTAAGTTEMADRLGVHCMSVYTGHELGLLALGQGDTREAIRCLEAVRWHPVAAQMRNPSVVPWVFDLVEAYIRDGRPADAEALLEEHAPGDGPGELWAHAAAARCRALLSDNGDMGDAFERALSAPGCDLMPFERARTELCFGERLRRTRRRGPARIQLRSALETFTRLGAAPWAQRAEAELRATGESVRRDTTMSRLTPQELQVALVVGRGASNHEAAAALFLSQKTIEYHLSNIYRKTNIHSRAELAGVAA